jgi:hypothetical protein
VAVLADQDALAVLANDGTGAFAEPEIVATVVDPIDVAAFDADRVGALDLVVAAGGPQPLALHPARGRRYPHRVTLFDAVARHRIAVADIDDDLLPDLVVAARDTASVTVFAADP